MPDEIIGAVVEVTTEAVGRKIERRFGWKGCAITTAIVFALVILVAWLIF